MVVYKKKPETIRPLRFVLANLSPTTRTGRMIISPAELVP